MVTQPLVFIGGGGHARSLLSLAQHNEEKYYFLAYSNQSRNTYLSYYLAGFVDFNSETKFPFGPYLGTDLTQLQSFSEGAFVIAIGHLPFAQSRKHIAQQLATLDLNVASPIVAATATIGFQVTLGDGTVVFHHVLLNTNVTVGKHCILNSGAILEHDTVIGDFVHIAPGAIVNGGCTIEDEVFVGSGAILFQNVKVGKGAVIGAGSVVKHSIPPWTMWAGNPARLIKNLSMES